MTSLRSVHLASFPKAEQAEAAASALRESFGESGTYFGFEVTVAPCAGEHHLGLQWRARGEDATADEREGLEMALFTMLGWAARQKGVEVAS